MLISRNWLQTYFEDELPSAEELVDTLMFHAFEIEGFEQVGDDWVIDVDVLPNRSSDCLSHRGIARELATLLSRPMKREPLRDSLSALPETETLRVVVDDTSLCPVYMGAVVRGVEVGESPQWLKDRLTAIGQKPINNLVDATNYVMFDLGQPLHVFDFEKLTRDDAGHREIRVRLATEGESIQVLTGEEYTVSETTQLITDGVADTPIAIAGVKGGKQAEIGPGTVDIVLESANFDYLSVRKTSRALKLATDASLRFQNEPAVQLPLFAMRDLIALITELAGGAVVGVSKVVSEAQEHLPIDLTLSEINTLLGVTLSIKDVENILVRFEWEFSLDGEEFAITPPWERTDLHSKEELIEEIGRVYGYRNIASVLPEKLETAPKVNKRQFYVEKIQHMLTDLGYSEVLTYTLQNKGEVELANPFASDKSCMRMDLRVGMLGALELNSNNAPFLGLDTVKIFEIGTIFREKGEVLHLALGARAVSGTQGKADKQLLADLATLAESLGVALSDEEVQDGVIEISLDALLPDLAEPEGYLPPLPWDTDKRYKPWSSYPCAYRDIAVWVPAGTPAEEVLAVIITTAPETLIKHYQFDSFEKDGRISYAWHLVFQHTEKTLTDTEVGEVMEQITTALGGREGWEVR